jgi:hypothetical protein
MTTETSGIEEKAVELIEKFEALAVDIAPDAIELGLMAARVAAANDIANLVIISAIFITCLWFTKRSFRLGRWDNRGNPENFWAIGQMIFSAVSVIFGGTAAIQFSIWPFVGIFYPELWIAKQVLGW